MEIEELIKEYSDSLYDKLPIFYKYLPVINGYADYFLQITELLEEKIQDDMDYHYDIDFLTIIEICEEILLSISPCLRDKFRTYLSDGTIEIDNDRIQGITYMNIQDGHININLNRCYDIEDVIGLIHEFFHAIHIEKYNNNLADEKWYIETEGIAFIGEIYAIIYMWQHDIVKEDIQPYYRKFLTSILSHADHALLTGLALEVYDKEQSLSDEAVSHFVDMKKMPEGYKGLNTLLETLDDCFFHESATYIFGFPMAFALVLKMLDDDDYRQKFLMCFEHIQDYAIEDWLKNFGLDGVINDEDVIYNVMNVINDLSFTLINGETLDVKKYLLEMRPL